MTRQRMVNVHSTPLVLHALMATTWQTVTNNRLYVQIVNIGNLHCKHNVEHSSSSVCRVVQQLIVQHYFSNLLDQYHN